jgi:hypothetical protein
MITRPKLEDYAFPKSENDYEQLGFYADYLEDYCDALEKAFNDACTYIHNDGYNGCPANYDNNTVANGKMKECYGCYYYCNGSYCNGSQSDPFYEEYRKKSIKCWRECFLKGDTENDEN